MKEFNYKECEQKKIKDNAILHDVEKANEEGKISKYSEEQILCAQKEEGKKAMNTLYYEGVFPLMNNILYIIYYVLSLITLPLIYVNDKMCNIIVVILGYITLIIIIGVIKCIEGIVRKKIYKKKQWMSCLEKFSLDTSIFVYILTSIGYVLVILEKLCFWYIYAIMCLIFIVAVYYDIVRPLGRM